MSVAPEKDSASSRLSVEQRLDQICDRFEKDWIAGVRPAIEEHLADIPLSERSALLRELLRLDLEYRRARGEKPAEEEYRNRFPDEVELIEAAFRQVLEAAPAKAIPTDSAQEFTGPYEPGTGVDQSSLPEGRTSRNDRISQQKVLGDYELLAELGCGGMGIVYKAWNRKAKRMEALKVIRPDRLADLNADQRARWLERFRTEAQAAARLNHEHVVTVYDVGEIDGRPYYSMRYIEGRSLEDLLVEGPLANDRAAALIEPVARAVHSAHMLGIFHRDLKPRNILLDGQDRPFVADFGLAKWLEAAQVTQAGEWLGTPSYMSPEQAQDAAHVTAASDVYSLGATLYALLTGRPPFQAATVAETLHQVKYQDPVPPRQLNSAIDKDLETITLKCLEKEPAKRFYPSAEALADELRGFLNKEPILARPSNDWDRTIKWVKRNPHRAVFVAVTGLVTVFLGIVSIAIHKRVRNQAMETMGALLKESGANRNLGVALQAERKTSYLHRIARAHREWQDNNIAKAEELLDDCPQDLRHWEWHYLKRLCHLDLRTFRAPSDFGFYAATLSRDGTRLAFVPSSDRKTVKIWNTATGEEILNLKTEADGLAFSPDGQRLGAVKSVYGAKSAVCQIWDAFKGHPLLRFDLPCSPSVMSFNPGGKRLAFGSYDGDVSVWDINGGKMISPLKGHPKGRGSNFITRVAFSPDGARLASLSTFDGRMKVWNLETGLEEISLNGVRGQTIIFSPDGKYLVSGGLIIWDAKSGKELINCRGQANVMDMAYSPDGKRLVVANADHTVTVWDTTFWTELFALKGHSDVVDHVAFHSNGERLVSVSRDGTMKVWDAFQSHEVRKLSSYYPKEVRGLSCIALHPDGKLVAAGHENGLVKVWDATVPAALPKDVGIVHWNGHPLTTTVTGDWPFDLPLCVCQGHTARVCCVDFSPDGKLLASASWDQTLKIWDVRTGQEKQTLRFGPFQGQFDGIRHIDFSPDNQHLASCVASQRDVKLWNIVTGKRLLTIKEDALGLAFRPGSNSLVVGAFDWTGKVATPAIKVFDPTNGRKLSTFKCNAGNIYNIAFSSDGKLLASTGDRAGVKIWDVSTGMEKITLKGHTHRVDAVVFSPDGQRLASTGADRTLKIWDVDTGQEMLSLSASGRTLAFSPDGNLLISDDVDVVGIWNGTPWTEPRGPLPVREFSQRRNQAQTPPGLSAALAPKAPATPAKQGPTAKEAGTSPELKSPMTATKPLQGVLAHFKFNGSAKDQNEVPFFSRGKRAGAVRYVRLKDQSGHNLAFELYNTEFKDNTLYLNGIQGIEKGGYQARCKTPMLDYAKFTVALRFKPEEFRPNKTNLITGGCSYRWFGLSTLPTTGNLMVTLNNGQFSHEIKNASVHKGKWTVVACGVDLSARKIAIYHNWRKAAEIDLPKDFKLDVMDAKKGKGSNDRVWSFTNYGNGNVFHGLVDELIIYGRMLSGEEFGRIPLHRD